MNSKWFQHISVGLSLFKRTIIVWFSSIRAITPANSNCKNDEFAKKKETLYFHQIHTLTGWKSFLALSFWGFVYVFLLHDFLFHSIKFYQYKCGHVAIFVRSSKLFYSFDVIILLASYSCVSIFRIQTVLRWMTSE